MLWGEVWEVACLCVGEVKCLSSASLATHLFSAKSAKEQQKRSWENEKEKKFPDILKTIRFLQKTCKQKF